MSPSKHRNTNIIIILPIISIILFLAPTAAFSSSFSSSGGKGPALNKQRELIARVINTAENAGIDSALFLALAIKESSFNPLAIHLSSPARPATRLGWKLRKLGIRYSYYRSNRRYHYNVRPSSRQQAAVLLKWASTKRFIWFDVGLFQVSHFKIKDLGINPVTLLEPRLNAAYAARIFKKCLLSEKNTAHALECYHRGPSRQSRKITDYARHTLLIARRLR